MGKSNVHVCIKERVKRIEGVMSVNKIHTHTLQSPPISMNFSHVYLSISLPHDRIHLIPSDDGKTFPIPHYYYKIGKTAAVTAVSSHSGWFLCWHFSVNVLHSFLPSFTFQRKLYTIWVKMELASLRKQRLTILLIKPSFPSVTWHFHVSSRISHNINKEESHYF